MNNFKKYAEFDVMITPTIIKVIFWIGVAASVIFGLITSLGGLVVMVSESFFVGFLSFIGGLFIIVIGSLMTRIYCELMIVVFKMQQSLHSIDVKLERENEVL